MSFSEAKEAILDIFDDICNLEFGKRRSSRFWHFIFGLIVLSLLAAGIFFGYRWYDSHRQQSTQWRYAKVLDALHVAQREDTPESWVLLAQQALEEGNHANKQAAPLFDVVRADAFDTLGKSEEMREAMKHAATSVAKKSPVGSLIQLKYALMLLDSVNTHEQQEGLQMLTELAKDRSNMHRDAALYFLGRYYWLGDEYEKARDIWSDLIESFASREYYATGESVSPWAIEAYTLLGYILE